MQVEMETIGLVRTKSDKTPRHWTLSDVEGFLDIDEKYVKGLKDIQSDQYIAVIFYFHKSPVFSDSLLIQKPKHKTEKLGVFSICSPFRPNPIGMSVLKVIRVKKNIIHVKGIDMLDGTPILDIKPHITDKTNCPSYDTDKKKD